MKLILCRNCHDVVRLQSEARACLCGLTKGRYLNNVQAIVSPNAVSIGLDNVTVAVALHGDPTAKHYLTCWARPNDGPLNPHTSVAEDGDWRWSL